jgi:peptide/nickel transport system substrate-binding protein
MAAGLLLAASADQSAAQTVKVAVPSEPATIDPHTSVGGAYDIAQALFDGLVKLDHDLQVIPRLAESWEQVDEVTWRFKLVEGATFHSGNPLNAEAVKAWFEATLSPDNPSVSAGMLWMVEEVRAMDAYTVEVVLSEPFGPFLRTFTLPHLVVYDAAERARLGDAFTEQPSGTGAFRFKEWRRGEALVLEANPDYRDPGKPRIDELEFRFIPEPSSRIAALEVGEVDIAYALPGHQIPRMEAMSGVTPLTERVLRPIIWYYNVRNPILADAAVRRALVHAVDMDLIGKTILEHGGEVLKGYITAGAYGALDTPFAYNPEYSMRLLEQAGWAKNSSGIYEKDGTPLSLTVQIGVDRYPDILAVGEAVQAQLRDLGVDFRIHAIEQATLEAGVTHARRATDEMPTFDMVTWGHGMRDGQAYFPLAQTYSVEGARGVGYANSIGHYGNPNYDRLMAIAVSPAPEAVQLQAYHDAQRVLYADVPGFPLYSPLWVRGIRDGVEGYRLHATEQEFWEDLELKR